MMPSYTSYRYGGGAPVRLTGKRNKDLAGFAGTIQQQAGGTRASAGNVDAILQGLFNDPTGGAGAYLPFFQNAAQAAAAPAMRDFGNIVSRQAANVAGRFGGNASTEEQRVVRRTSDDFTRNLTEALARVGPQAITAAQGQQRNLLGAREMYGAENLDFMNMLMSSILGQQKKSNIWGKLLGAAGGIAGTFLGGPGGGAIGYNLGSSIGG